MEITDLNNKIRIYTRFKDYGGYEDPILGNGHWCGYIEIPKGHPVNNRAFGDAWEDYAIIDSYGREINYSVFNDGVLTLGFDCGHSTDTKETNTEEHAMKCLESMKKDVIQEGIDYVTVLYKDGSTAILNDMDEKLNDCVTKVIDSIDTLHFVKECFGDNLDDNCLMHLSRKVFGKLADRL
jgi:hypothetical protein